MNDNSEIWDFQLASPAIVHRGTNDGTVPICFAAKREYGIGKIGELQFVCASDDMPDPKKYQGYAGYAWCTDCKWAVEHMKTPEFMELLKRRGSTIPLIIISV